MIRDGVSYDNGVSHRDEGLHSNETTQILARNKLLIISSDTFQRNKHHVVAGRPAGTQDVS